MSVYLDRLTEEFNTITTGMDAVLDRAADENRDVSAEETTIIERDRSRAEELRSSIEFYGNLETTRGRVRDVLARVPAGSAPTVQRAAPPAQEPETITDIFPTAGDYITTVARAMRGERESAELIQRAETAHQVLADNPGIVPRPVVAPIISLIESSRPFIQSLRSRPLTAGSFDRPIITQHVAVAKQDAEKDRTASREMKIGKLPVEAATYAGHLNISRQNVKWTQPGIMQLITEDFGDMYALETDEDAVAQFVASVAALDRQSIAAWDGPNVSHAIFTAAAAAIQRRRTQNSGGVPDTLWASADVWGALGSLYSPMGTPVFPSLTPGNTTGNALGLQIVVDPFFDPGTFALGPSRLLEWYEDLDGLITVQEPDVLGQLVGYAGFGAFLNTAPGAFTVFDVPALPDPPTGNGSGEGGDAEAATATTRTRAK